MNGKDNYNQTGNIVPNQPNIPNNTPNNSFNPVNKQPTAIPNQPMAAQNQNITAPNQPMAVPNQSMAVPNQSMAVPNQPQPATQNRFINTPNDQNLTTAATNNRQIAATNTVIGSEVNNQLPVSNQSNAQTNSQIVLGTVSNVTYRDTLGDLSVPTNNNIANSSDQNNQFINNNDYNSTMIDDLNVEGTYNDMPMNSPSDYINDPKVQENLNPQKKKTVTVSAELKTVFILVLILLAFTFLIPVLSDLLNELRFR